MLFSQEATLSGGIDIADQLRRLARAECLGEQLAASIQGWHAARPFTFSAEIAEDRLSWTLSLTVTQDPPLDTEWNFLFGECVHNLRAALDNLVVGIARRSSVRDEKGLKRISFPISASEEEWKKDQSKVKLLPEAFRSSIEALQPFQPVRPPNTPAGPVLLALRDLSNQDKHHLQIEASLDPLTLGYGSMVEFETEAGAAASVPPDLTIFGTNFRDGDILLRHRTSGRIAKVRGGYNEHFPSGFS